MLRNIFNNWRILLNKMLFLKSMFLLARLVEKWRKLTIFIWRQKSLFTSWLEVKVMEMTILNTFAYRYLSFFHILSSKIICNPKNILQIGTQHSICYYRYFISEKWLVVFLYCQPSKPSQPSKPKCQPGKKE